MRLVGAGFSRPVQQKTPPYRAGGVAVRFGSCVNLALIPRTRAILPGGPVAVAVMMVRAVELGAHLKLQGYQKESGRINHEGYFALEPSMNRRSSPTNPSVASMLRRTMTMAASGKPDSSPNVNAANTSPSASTPQSR